VGTRRAVRHRGRACCGRVAIDDGLARPVAAQTRLAHTGTEALDGLRAHSTWTTARDRDHLSSAVSTATELLVTTRYATDADGVETRPSRFLEAIAPTAVATDAHQALIADPTALPDPITDQLPPEGGE